MTGDKVDEATVLAEFRHDGTARALGCLVYALIAPAIAFVVVVTTFVASFQIGKLVGWDEGLRLVIALPSVPVGTGLGIWFSWRGYRRGCDASFVVTKTGMDIGHHQRTESFPYDDIRHFVVENVSPPHFLLIVLEDGRRFRLPSGLLTFEQLWPLVEAGLLPSLVRRLMERMTSRGLEIPPVSVWTRFTWRVRGIAHRVLGLVHLVGVPIHVDMGHGATARALLKRAHHAESGALRLTRDGIDGVALSVRWSELELVDDDEAGLGLRTDCGRSLGLPGSAPNYPAIAAIVRRMIETEGR